jgi:hypothetical protein
VNCVCVALRVCVCVCARVCVRVRHPGLPVCARVEACMYQCACVCACMSMPCVCVCPCDLQGQPRFPNTFALQGTKGVVQLVDKLWTGTNIVLVMEKLRPVSWSKVDNDEKLAQKFCAGLLQAVRGLHTRGICHLDIKEDNIMVAGTGPSAMVTLTDLGCAWWLGDRMPFIVGTHGYQAPEMKSGSSRTAQASMDIYSVGRVVQRLANRAGWRGDGLVELAERMCAEEAAERPSCEDALASVRALGAGGATTSRVVGTRKGGSPKETALSGGCGAPGQASRNVAAGLTSAGGRADTRRTPTTDRLAKAVQGGGGAGIAPTLVGAVDQENSAPNMPVGGRQSKRPHWQGSQRKLAQCSHKGAMGKWLTGR